MVLNVTLVPYGGVKEISPWLLPTDSELPQAATSLKFVPVYWLAPLSGDRYLGPVHPF